MLVSSNPCRLLVTADDRTGALEIGGAVGNADFLVPVGPYAESDICCTIDLNSRHLSASEAYKKTLEAHRRPADKRCHKMDSGMRGNWPHEVQALVDLGHLVAVVPSYPAAGRRCRNGVVYINDVPVLDSVFGKDPFAAPVSNRPTEVLEHAGCLSNNVVVWDADNTHELEAAISRCRKENRVLVGPTGAISTYAEQLFGKLERQDIVIPHPILVVCGSLSGVSRDQLERLDCPRFGLDDDLDCSLPLAVLETEFVKGQIDVEEGRIVAEQIAAKVSDVFDRGTATLLIIGGDTATEIIGDRTLEVLGEVDTAIPVSRVEAGFIVTKGGAIGTPTTLKKICQ